MALRCVVVLLKPPTPGKALGEASPTPKNHGPLELTTETRIRSSNANAPDLAIRSVQTIDADHSTQTTASMPMPTHERNDHTGMTMDVVFITSITTPLWSKSFTPKNVGQYAGICIFLVAFATTFRLLVAFRTNFLHFDASCKGNRIQEYLLRPQNPTEGETGNDVGAVHRPWRPAEAVLLGMVDVIIAGVSYLLMLAVMTMNIGYFLSVLGGVFIGSVLCGHLTGSSPAH